MPNTYLTDTIERLANLALSHYTPGLLDYVDDKYKVISDDLRRHYQQADLRLIFDYLEELNEEDYDKETILINSIRGTLTDYIIYAYNENK